MGNKAKARLLARVLSAVAAGHDADIVNLLMIDGEVTKAEAEELLRSVEADTRISSGFPAISAGVSKYLEYLDTQE